MKPVEKCSKRKTLRPAKVSLATRTTSATQEPLLLGRGVVPGVVITYIRGDGGARDEPCGENLAWTATLYEL